MTPPPPQPSSPVRLGRGSQQQVAAEVEALGGRRQRPGHANRLDLLPAQAYVDDLAGGEPHATEQQAVPTVRVTWERHLSGLLHVL